MEGGGRLTRSLCIPPHPLSNRPLTILSIIPFIIAAPEQMFTFGRNNWYKWQMEKKNDNDKFLSLNWWLTHFSFFSTHLVAFLNGHLQLKQDFPHRECVQRQRNAQTGAFLCCGCDHGGSYLPLQPIPYLMWPGENKHRGADTVKQVWETLTQDVYVPARCSIHPVVVYWVTRCLNV